MTLHGRAPSLARDLARSARREARAPRRRRAASVRGADYAAPVSRDEGAGDAERPAPDPRDLDDPARLADEAREQRERMAAELRAAGVPIATEPATTFRP
jgi:hypothetical protein